MTGKGIVISIGIWYDVDVGNHGAMAALPLLYLSEGLSSPPDERKEGDAVYVTYQDLIQIGILIVALANLIYQIYKGKKK